MEAEGRGRKRETSFVNPSKRLISRASGLCERTSIDCPVKRKKKKKGKFQTKIKINVVQNKGGGEMKRNGE